LPDKYKNHLINFLKNENTFKKYLNIDNTEPEMFQGILDLY